MWDLGGWVRGLAWWGSLNQSTFFGCFLLHFFNQIRLTRMKSSVFCLNFLKRHMQREDRLVAWPCLLTSARRSFHPSFCWLIIFWGDFGPFLGSIGVILEPLRDHFGIVLAPFWGSFCPFLGHFYGRFAGFFFFVMKKVQFKQSRGAIGGRTLSPLSYTLAGTVSLVKIVNEKE